MADEVSSYEIERNSFFNVFSIEELVNEAHEKIVKECKERLKIPDKHGVALVRPDKLLPHPEARRPETRGSNATTPGHASDLLAFTVLTRDFLDVIFPRLKLRVTAKCKTGDKTQFKGQL